ncbi:hypothetical protein G9A89_004497 [Geosiphon pyriformis]|nr:hypothetical protein G9A89_004497 [Geosiphon pyriformis]
MLKNPAKPTLRNLSAAHSDSLKPKFPPIITSQEIASKALETGQILTAFSAYQMAIQKENPYVRNFSTLAQKYWARESQLVKAKYNEIALEAQNFFHQIPNQYNILPFFTSSVPTQSTIVGYNNYETSLPSNSFEKPQSLDDSSLSPEYINDVTVSPLQQQPWNDNPGLLETFSNKELPSSPIESPTTTHIIQNFTIESFDNPLPEVWEINPSNSTLQETWDFIPAFNEQVSQGPSSTSTTPSFSHSYLTVSPDLDFAEFPRQTTSSNTLPSPVTTPIINPSVSKSSITQLLAVLANNLKSDRIPNMKNTVKQNSNLEQRIKVLECLVASLITEGCNKIIDQM